jgi:hypothetical protein
LPIGVATTYSVPDFVCSVMRLLSGAKNSICLAALC